MKRRIASLLALLLSAALLVGAAAETAGDDFLGTWYLNEALYNGARFSPSAIGIEVTLILNADGSALVVNSGTELPGTWSEADGSIILRDESEEMKLVFEDDSIVVDGEDGMRMVYRREPGSENPYEAPMLEEVAFEDFEGDWTAVSVNLNGVLFTIEQMGVKQAFAIGDGRVELIEGESDPVELEYAQVENALELTDPDGSGVPMRLCLHEDGALSARMEQSGGFVVIYFEKTPDQAGK